MGFKTKTLNNRLYVKCK